MDILVNYFSALYPFSKYDQNKMSAADSRVSITGKLGLRPFTTHNILFYYAPIQGALSYTSLSVNVMNPSLVLRFVCMNCVLNAYIIFILIFRIFPKRDITNILLFNSLVGSGLYLYNRQHLSTLPTKERLLYR